ncbi:MAG: hypothetical protein JWQ60_1121 [Pseudonocardia sp.]|jgi:hypothetical protein|nr:hypothetical protein [Pseudonocardia sp.]
MKHLFLPLVTFVGLMALISLVSPPQASAQT